MHEEALARAVFPRRCAHTLTTSRHRVLRRLHRLPCRRPFPRTMHDAENSLSAAPGSSDPAKVKFNRVAPDENSAALVSRFTRGLPGGRNRGSACVTGACNREEDSLEARLKAD